MVAHVNPIDAASDSQCPAPEPQASEDIALSIRRRPTAKQLAILGFLNEHIGAHGYPPTLREIGTRFGIRSTNGVDDHLRALERKGLIRRTDGKSRGAVPVTTVAVSDTFLDAIGEWKIENRALVALLEKVLQASGRLPRLTPEFVVLLGDIRDAAACAKGGRRG